MENLELTQTEWQAWQLVVSRWAALMPESMNAPQYDPLVRAIEAWGELLVELRMSQPPNVVTQARQERLFAAL